MPPLPTCLITLIYTDVGLFCTILLPHSVYWPACSHIYLFLPILNQAVYLPGALPDAYELLTVLCLMGTGLFLSGPVITMSGSQVTRDYLSYSHSSTCYMN